MRTEDFGWDGGRRGLNNMNKREVLSSLTIIANKLDDSGNHQSADALTQVARRVAQYDDDFGDDYQDRSSAMTTTMFMKSVS